jgi:hypothetical protein
MSRTFRCRRSVPHGWEVRDGGYEFHRDLSTKHGRREHWRAEFKARYLAGESTWFYEADPLLYPPPYRGSRLNQERKWYRKQHFRQYRSKVRNAMRHGRWEDIPRFRRTSGWLTW